MQEEKRVAKGITRVILINMKTAISIPDSLFVAAERLAKRLGISRSELFQRAMKSFLREKKDEGITDALNKVYGPGCENGKLDSVLEAMQYSSLPKEDWE